MKHLILTLCIFCTSLSFAQKSVYQSDSFDALSADHKVLAILPFQVRLELSDQDEASEEQLKALEKREGFAVQSALEAYFLKRDKRKDYRVDFQNVKNTNALLLKAGITADNIDIKTTHELSDILGVDGVITGDMAVNALISEGVDTSFSFMDYISGKSDYGRITIKLSDGKTGKLLWRYEQVIDRKAGKNTTAIIEKMMRKSTRKFPYDKGE